LGYSLSLKGQIATLVYPGALKRPAEPALRENFVLRRLASLLAAAAAMPVYLATHGIPTPLHAMVFLWLMTPLGAIALLSSTGDLLRAEAMSIFGLTAAGLTAAIGGDHAVLAWIILAPFDAIFSLNALVVCVSGGVAAVTALALIAAAAFGFSKSTVGMASAGIFLLPAIVYAAIVALSFVRLQISRSRGERRPQAERFAAVAEAFGDLVVTYDRSGAATSVSSNCQSLFGLPPSELMGRSFFEHVHVADRPAFLNAIAEACGSGATVNAALRLRVSAVVERSAYREPIFIRLDMRARRCDEDRRPEDGNHGKGAIAIFRDITNAHWGPDQLKSGPSDAEEAGASKDHFLANMSHELRTPLNAIIGFSEILSDTQLVPPERDKQREYAEIILQSGKHLLAVVNSILDLSKIQSGSFDLSAAPFSIGSLIDLCCDMVKLGASERGLELVRVYPERFAEVMGDKRACKQILINLLSNAVKFTPAGGAVTVSAKLEGNSLLLLVADTGVGINALDLARLGDPFFQAKGSLDRPFEGTGLGLSIVRGLVGLHGGSISLASEPDQGTCVLVRLPLDFRSAGNKGQASARIDTIARYRRGDEQYDFSQQMTVKKIA
jgi:cell cycle sensor histidine kinase DivJ